MIEIPLFESLIHVKAHKLKNASHRQTYALDVFRLQGND